MTEPSLGSSPGPEAAPPVFERPNADSRRLVPATTPGRVGRREAKRFAKFLMVGAISFVIETGSLTLFALVASVDRVLAKGLAFSLSVLSNFLWNRFFTYPESRSKDVVAQAFQFGLLSVVGLGINVSVFAVTDRLLLEHWHWGEVFSLYAAQCTAVGVTLIWNFTSNRLITYGDIKLGR